MVLEASSAVGLEDSAGTLVQVQPADPVTTTASSPAPLARRSHRKILCVALSICAVFYVVTHWVVWPVRVNGESMAPNYDDGQRTVINRFAYLSNRPQRGDVVGLHVGSEFYIKRIIGLPGERIEFERDTVLVNGRPLKEWYPVKPLLWKLAPMQLGADDYYVMGDNRSMSKLGPVPREQIIGKAMF